MSAEQLQPAEKWITLPVEPIVDAKTYALVKALCEQRRPTELPGRASTKPRVLTAWRAAGSSATTMRSNARGGVTAHDRVEVQPWLEREQRWSFVTSDPRAIDLACFRHLLQTH